MESMHFINLIWITKQQYVIKVITVIKFKAGPKLDMESHSEMFLDIYFIAHI
jgi:hypothetical protein